MRSIALTSPAPPAAAAILGGKRRHAGNRNLSHRGFQEYC